jgi:hypothetical protein
MTLILLDDPTFSVNPIQTKKWGDLIHINRITATDAHTRHRFSWASFKLYNFANFCLFAIIAQNVANVLNLTSGIRVSVVTCRA